MPRPRQIMTQKDYNANIRKVADKISPAKIARMLDVIHTWHYAGIESVDAMQDLIGIAGEKLTKIEQVNQGKRK